MFVSPLRSSKFKVHRICKKIPVYHAFGSSPAAPWFFSFFPSPHRHLFELFSFFCQKKANVLLSSFCRGVYTRTKRLLVTCSSLDTRPSDNMFTCFLYILWPCENFFRWPSTRDITLSAGPSELYYDLLYLLIHFSALLFTCLLHSERHWGGKVLTKAGKRDEAFSD